MGRMQHPFCDIPAIQPQSNYDKTKIERHSRKVAILTCQGHESHGKTKELFQTEEDNEMTTECNV